MWQQDKSPEAPGRLENLKELVRALADFDTLGVSRARVVGDGERSGGRGRAGQHDDTARGQGARVRYGVPAGWEEGLFPSQRTLDEGGLKGLEEERGSPMSA